MGFFYGESMANELIRGLLQKNASVPFVDRILNREKYPVLENKDGTYSTHSMAWGEADGKYFVYPTVVPSNGGMVRLPPRKAWERAMKEKDFIKFGSPEEADWFSKRYKDVWSKE